MRGRNDLHVGRTRGHINTRLVPPIALVEAIAKEHDINVIYSFANPIESNIIGAMLAKKFPTVSRLNCGIINH